MSTSACPSAFTLSVSGVQGWYFWSDTLKTYDDPRRHIALNWESVGRMEATSTHDCVCIGGNDYQSDAASRIHPIHTYAIYSLLYETCTATGSFHCAPRFSTREEMPAVRVLVLVPIFPALHVLHKSTRPSFFFSCMACSHPHPRSQCVAKEALGDDTLPRSGIMRLSVVNGRIRWGLLSWIATINLASNQ